MSSHRGIVLVRKSVTHFQLRPLSTLAQDRVTRTAESTVEDRFVDATLPSRLFSTLSAEDTSSFHTSPDRVLQSLFSRTFSENTPSEDNTDTTDDDDQNEEITMEELEALASQPCTPLTVSDMCKYASSNAQSKYYYPQRLRNARFLHKELQIRIAQRAVCLLTLPEGLNTTTHVQKIAHIYIQYLGQFKKCPCPSNKEEELAFTDMLRVMVLDRTSIPMAIAKGIACLKDDRKESVDIQRFQELENALYRFFTARVGLRLLTEHHVLSCIDRQDENEELRLRQGIWGNVPLPGRDNSFLGCIEPNCNPTEEAKRVATQVMSYCRECFGVTPEIEVLDCTPEKYANANFTYVPHHLQFMLVELLTNSCSAIIERYATDLEDQSNTINNEKDVKTLPPVRVVIVKGAEDVTIKIADKGGGVARSVIDKVWTFTHTANSEGVENVDLNGKNSRVFGLPHAQIYARYLGGELTVKSMEGYGVDAYLYLPMLGDVGENLPKRVLLSPGNADSTFDGNHDSTHHYDRLNIVGDEHWAGSGGRHFSTMSLANLRKNAL